MSVAKSAWIIDVTQADFQATVIERSHERPVVVDFWAPWCPPCRLLGPALEKVVSERAGEVILAKVNVDEAQELAAQYHVEGIPAVKAFRDGRPVLEFVGALPESQVRAFVERILPSEADQLARQADGVKATDAVKAEAWYRQALAKDSRHEAAALGLAQLLLDQGKDQEAAEVLQGAGAAGAEAERLEAILSLREMARQFGNETKARRQLEAEPESATRHYELGCVLAAAGKYREALENLLWAAEHDPKSANTLVRPAMVEIFHAIGVRNPLADEFRDKLARLLY